MSKNKRLQKPIAIAVESANVGLWDWAHPSLRIMVDFIRLVRDAAQ